MFEEYADVLTAEEACEALRIGYNALYELLNSGKLKGFRNGRVWRIPQAGGPGIHPYIIVSALYSLRLVLTYYFNLTNTLFL